MLITATCFGRLLLIEVASMGNSADVETTRKKSRANPAVNRKKRPLKQIAALKKHANFSFSTN